MPNKIEKTPIQHDFGNDEFEKESEDKEETIDFGFNDETVLVEVLY